MKRNVTGIVRSFGLLSVLGAALATAAGGCADTADPTLAFLAVSPWHLFWSQSVRFYSVELFFVLLAAACFFAGVESGRRRWLLGSLLFAGLAGLTHPSAALVVVGFVAFLVAMRFGPFEWPERLDSRAILTFALPLIVGGLVLLTSVVEAWTQFRSTKPEDETLFRTSTNIRAGEYTVLGATGMSPLFVVLRLELL